MPVRESTTRSGWQKLVDSLHAYQARVLVRHMASWARVRALAKLGVDLVAIREDEREVAGNLSGTPRDG
jgi:hypothetical protein